MDREGEGNGGRKCNGEVVAEDSEWKRMEGKGEQKEEKAMEWFNERKKRGVGKKMGVKGEQEWWEENRKDNNNNKNVNNNKRKIHKTLKETKNNNIQLQKK